MASVGSFNQLAAQEKGGDQLKPAYQGPDLDVRRQPAEYMQVLVGEWKESVVVIPYRFIDEFSPEAEIVEELITKDVVVPSDDFLVKPAASCAISVT